MSFAHALSVRSDFSIGESLLQVDHIIKQAKDLGYESVALVDTMSIHNVTDFCVKAKKAGLKPIVGCRLRVYDDAFWKKPTKASGIADKPNPMVCIKVYVKGDDGINGLMKLLSAANTREQFYYHSRCGWGDVAGLKDVVISTGDFFSLWHHPHAQDIYGRLIARFDEDHVFSELVPINTPLFDTLNNKAIQGMIAHGGRPLVTYPTLYAKDEDATTLEVLNAITSNSKMSSPARPHQFVQDFGFKAPQHLAAKIKEAHARQQKFYGMDAPAAWAKGVKNIPVLAHMCQYEFKKQPVSLPKMADNEFATLGKKCIEGWKKRFSAPVLGYLPKPEDMPKYKERLQYELGVLKSMGFSGYFLLVEDLVNWAKSNGIIVGPGRGSVGGSLVAYLLGITEVDPIRFDLLFERFINPERLDLPDADLDFMSTRRHEVVQYLQGKYGADRVAGISNFSTLASASALRDAGRVHDLSNLQLMATKLVPKEHGQSSTLTEAAKAVPELDKFKTDHPVIWDHAIKLEGVMRALGKHAAGVVVGGEPLVNRAVVETRENSEGIPVVAWDKRVVEDWGLVKMDVLGLSTLDVLEIGRGYIHERHGINVDFTALPLEEEDIMDAFGKGDTTGVFQFESPGMRKLLKDLRVGGPLSFEDITAATALYRPGPMDSGLMDDFVNIKQGHLSEFYEHPNMEASLKSTRGVIVYQEQVMQLAIDLAGFTKAGADHLRKAMGKKDKDKMAEQRKAWVDGCLSKSGMAAPEAGSLFDKIEAFAGYGFNRSHAVEYSIISYWTMWMRVRYPAEYFAACLSIVPEDKVTGLVKDAREYGIEVLPPDVNLSTHRFTIPDDKHLLAPFNSVKLISENTAAALVGLREAQPSKRFDTVEHFRSAASQKGSKVNARVVANLIAVGATASLDPTQKAARHPDRRKDQTELMPGLIVDSIKADRVTDVTDKFIRAKVIHIVQEYRGCNGCNLASQPHPQVRLKSNVKFMVVSDCPTWQEERADKLMEGDAATAIRHAMKEAGISPADGYYTTLVKAKKDDKFLSNQQINGCARFLDAEIELIKPAVIVTLGSAAMKRFLPDLKGGTAEHAGKVVYDSKLDASIVVGINAQQVHFDGSKVNILIDVFKKVFEIIS